jgi:4a-hydroxytetrahydrobiopterin dehydratase
MRVMSRADDHEPDDHMGPGDFRLLSDGLAGRFRTGSFAAGAELLAALAPLPAGAAVDLRQAWLTVRLGPAETDAARRIAGIAQRLGIPADPSTLQSILVKVAATDPAAVQPLWQATLGYRPAGPGLLVDPHGRNPAFVFRTDERVSRARNRIHIDLVSPYDAADARRTATLDAGGRVVSDDRPWVIADQEGNETCAGGAEGGLVPRDHDQRAGWDGVLADDSAGPVEVGWREFHETDGVADWRMLDLGANTWFRTGSFDAGIRLVRAICALPGLTDRRSELDLRADGVTVRLITLTESFGGPASQRDVLLARQISALADDLGLAADPTAVQSLMIAIDAVDSSAVIPFWLTALGYEKRPDTDEDLLDPYGRGPVVWFQQTEARPIGDRIRLELSLPHDQLSDRVTRLVAVGGTVVESPATHVVLADAEGHRLVVKSLPAPR